jgi:hypothetical protein
VRSITRRLIGVYTRSVMRCLIGHLYQSITGMLIGVYIGSVTAASEADVRLYVKYYGQANRHICMQG